MAEDTTFTTGTAMVKYGKELLRREQIAFVLREQKRKNNINIDECFTYFHIPSIGNLLKDN